MRSRKMFVDAEALCDFFYFFGISVFFCVRVAERPKCNERKMLNHVQTLRQEYATLFYTQIKTFDSSKRIAKDVALTFYHYRI